jgi:toxin HigB-1
MAIQNFSDKNTEEFYYTGKVQAKAGWKAVSNVALRKLDMLEYAHELLDLRSPPGNRLEELKGKFKGHHSIRINDQWRIVFMWTALGPKNVKICDYH